MTDTYAAGLRLVEQHGENQLREFELFGAQWDLLPEVFSPMHTASTTLFTEWLPYPAGGSFLEVGCGAGITAVTAALKGCARVAAVDINPAAVRNTRLNAARRGVADRVKALESDLFDALVLDERFDVVFWNSNAVCAPEEFVYTRQAQHAIFDRGYLAHRRYLREGMARLTQTGRLFLGFNSLGNPERLQELAVETGVELHERAGSTQKAGDIPVRFQLLEVVGRTVDQSEDNSLSVDN